MPARLAEDGNDAGVSGIRRIDVTRSQGVTVVAIHTAGAIVLLAPGCVIIFRDHQMNVLVDGSNHELDLE
jgi:hypothetical protein